MRPAVLDTPLASFKDATGSSERRSKFSSPQCKRAGGANTALKLGPTSLPAPAPRRTCHTPSLHPKDHDTMDHSIEEQGGNNRIAIRTMDADHQGDLGRLTIWDLRPWQQSPVLPGMGHRSQISPFNAHLHRSNGLQIKYTTEEPVEDGGFETIFEYTGHETAEESLSGLPHTA